ncbi:phosphorylase [Myxococcota bacterium]|nr:phosphorylase [Myxococcota bacterium]
MLGAQPGPSLSTLFPVDPLNPDDLLARPGALATAIQERSRRSAASGARLSLTTHRSTLRDAGVDFAVHVLERVTYKERHGNTLVAEDRNPFLDIEPDLWVGDLPPKHRVLLNKFNVVENHALVVTRSFEPQTHPLTAADFEAAWHCLGQLDGLVFYNGGEAAGASQPHKHLQLLPLPLDEGPARIPLEPLLRGADPSGRVTAWPELPFAHACVAVAECAGLEPAEAGLHCEDLYVRLRNAAGCPDPAPYNLLLTRQWMWVVARSRDAVEDIPVNAMGYAGCLLVRDKDGLAALQRRGALEVLRRAGFPRDP